MQIKQITGETQNIIFQEYNYDFLTGKETPSVNEWAKHIDNINVILSDFHDNEAQVVYLNGTKNYSIDFRNANAIEVNFNSKYGVGTKVWYKVVIG